MDKLDLQKVGPVLVVAAILIAFLLIVGGEVVRGTIGADTKGLVFNLVTIAAAGLGGWFVGTKTQDARTSAVIQTQRAQIAEQRVELGILKAKE